MGATRSNLGAVQALIEDAKPVASVSRFDRDPEPGGKLDGVLPGQWVPDRLGLPKSCPVIPLGIAGSTGWFIDPIGQVQLLAPPYGKGHLLGLFCGRSDYLTWAWPRYGKNGIDGYAAEQAAAALLAACAAKGPWHAVEKIRGRGAWLTADGQLILHLGTSLSLAGRPEPPGEIDGFVYPTRPEIAGPWPSPSVNPSGPGPAEETRNPARLLRPLIQSWNWARPDIDPQLLLGWIGAAFVGGALPWRPTVYITGDKGAGKSTVQELVKGLVGDWMIQAVDTSAAGLYQHIGHDCLAIAVDELEGRADGRKAKAVLELARISASGGLMLRGGDRHTGVEFRARSCFLFSSINTPPLEPQDLSRMALLRLHKLDLDATPPDLDAQTLSVLGRLILQRLVAQWERYRYTWKCFRDELRRGGMDARGCDTFGTLLACADLIEYDGWNEDRLKTATAGGDLVVWHELMAVGRMHEFEDSTENWLLCLNHMLSFPVDAWRNSTRTTPGQVLESWFKNTDFDGDVVKVRNVLGQAGLGLQRRGGRHGDWLVIPNQNPLTRRLFEGTKWVGDMGASVWAGALRQATPEIAEPGQCKVNGVKSRATLVSLGQLYGPGGIMADEAPVDTPSQTP